MIRKSGSNMPILGFLSIRNHLQIINNLKRFINIIIILGSFFSSAFGQIPIAVLDFDAKGVSTTEVSALTDRLRDELFLIGRELGKYRVMERSLMEDIMEEQNFQISGCTSDECAVEVGKIIGVEQIIGGSISKVENVYAVSARIISVESGEILHVATYDLEGSIADLLTQGMSQVARRLVLDESTGKKSLSLSLGALYVISNPPGASVLIDGKTMEGKTPLIIENQPVGKHTVSVEKDGISADTTVQIVENDIQKFDLILRETGQLNLITSPFEAEVLLNGENIGVSPLVKKGLKKGQYNLKVMKAGYDTVQETIEITKNKIKKVNIQLNKLATLSIASEPSNSEVFVNGEFVGKTPVQVSIKSGKHKISTNREGYYSYEQFLELKPGEIKKINAKLHVYSGNLNITSNPGGADVDLDGKFIGNSPVKLTNIPVGAYKVGVYKNGYVRVDKSITIQKDLNKVLHIGLSSVVEIQKRIKRLQTKKYLWGGTSLLLLGSGGYLKHAADKHYREYTYAKNNAVNLRRKYELEDTLYPIIAGVGAACLFPMIVQHFKIKHFKKQIKLSSVIFIDTNKVVVNLVW